MEPQSADGGVGAGTTQAAPTVALDGRPSQDAGWWAERKDLQVQKMEATIEQDLSKAMAGLREQYRHQPSPLGGTRNDGGMSPGEQAHRNDAAAMAEFRSEAAAARDEMLEGLARLRRELESQRLQASPGPTMTPPQSGRTIDVEALTARPLASLREDLQALTRRVEALEAKDLQSVPATMSKEAESNLRSAAAELAEALTGEVEQRTVEVNHVHRRMDDIQGMLQMLVEARHLGSNEAAAAATSAADAEVLATLRELSESLNVERTSRQAQIMELRSVVVEELQSRIGSVVEAVRSETQLRVELLAQDLRFELEQQREAYAQVLAQAEGSGGLAGGGYGGDYGGGEPTEDYHQYDAAEHGSLAGVPTQSVEYYRDNTTMDQGGSRAREPEQQQQQQHQQQQHQYQQQPLDSGALLPGDLKQSLEELVEKVHLTLNNTGGGARAASSLGSSMNFGAPGPVLTSPARSQYTQLQPMQSWMAEGAIASTPATPVGTTMAPATTFGQRFQPQARTYSVPSAALLPGAAPLRASMVVKMMPSSAVLPAAVYGTPLLVHQTVVPINAVPYTPLNRMTTAGAGPTPPDGASVAVGESKDIFKKCLEDLRQENAALRASQEASSPGVAATEDGGSMVFVAAHGRARSPVRSFINPHQVVVGTSANRGSSPSRGSSPTNRFVPVRTHGSIAIPGGSVSI